MIAEPTASRTQWLLFRNAVTRSDGPHRSRGFCRRTGHEQAVQRTGQPTAGEYGRLRPPAAVQDLHTRLVAAMRSLADDLPKLLDAVSKAKEPSEAIATLFGAKSIQALITLQQEYKDKGYDISSLLDAG